MIDAYTIGITLALDNGVASGIAAIRQDLAALDRAVASSSAALLAMRQLSQSANVATSPRQITPPPGLPPPPSQPVEFTPAPPLSATPANAPDLQPPRRPLRETNTESLSPTVVHTIPAAAEPTYALRPLRPVDTPGPNAPAVPVNAGIDPKPISPAASPPIQPSAATPSIAALLPAVPAESRRPIAQASAPQPLPPRRLQPLEPPSHAPRQAEVAVQHAALAPMQLPPPRAASYQPIRSGRPQSPARADALPPSRDTVSNSTSGPAHGEIILDGVRLGRWMADRLARAASRPGSGTTAFDPRVSAVYPGAPTGY